MNIKRNFIPTSLYSWKSPYEMRPSRIVIHNTANDASAANEIKYMHRTKAQGGVQVSFHYAVDDKEIIQGIPENRNAWHAGDGVSGLGNREGIAIEICYSKSGGERFLKAEENTIDLIVDILNRYNWTIDKVTKHQDYMNKRCPHRTLDLGWNRFIKMIKERLGEGNIIPGAIYHTVKTGENLSSIGRRYNIDWKKIYNQNKNIIGPNANFIKSGIELLIPTTNIPAKFKIGDKVVFIKDWNIYKSSTAENPVKSVYNGGTITKIYPEAKNPYLLNNGRGFVRTNDIMKI